MHARGPRRRTVVLGTIVGAMIGLLANASVVSSQTLEIIPGLAGGIIRTHQVSGDGRKVVFASAGNPTGQNADGNVEIFIYDVATKQTFQLTRTTSQLWHRLLGGSWR